MDNPYLPPTTPHTAAIDQIPANRSVTIDSPSGPVRLEKHEQAIILVFNDVRKEIPIGKFVSQIALSFSRTKRISFKPIGLYRIAVSEEKFREVLDFYGVEHFKNHDIQSMRGLYAMGGLVFLINPLLDWASLTRMPLFALTIAGVFTLCLSLFALTFSRRYLAYLRLSTFAYFLFTALFGILWYLHGDWWMIILGLIISYGISTKLARIRYFSQTANTNPVG